MSRVVEEDELQQTYSHHDSEIPDLEDVPDHYRRPAHTTSRAPRGNIHERQPPKSIDNSESTRVSNQSLAAEREPSRQKTSHHQQATQEIQAPTFIGKVFGLLGSTTSRGDKSKLKHGQDIEISKLRSIIRSKETEVKTILRSHSEEVNRIYQNHNAELNNRQLHWEQQASRQTAALQGLQSEIKRIESYRIAAEEKYEMLIRKQQEESFKSLETGRWIPTEESKVLGNLERIKKDIRMWAKNAAINSLEIIHTLEVAESAELMGYLSSVAAVKNNQLPEGLSTKKAPSLLLNALLSHCVFTSLFQNPFFFLNRKDASNPKSNEQDNSLDEIYRVAQGSDLEVAHTWRSQTLRMLLPPLRATSTSEEKSLREMTEGKIAQAAEFHAERFTTSPARHLINTKAPAETIQKLHTIFQEAATFSYQLWTRRTAMKLTTLSEMKDPVFDAENQSQKAHSLVHYEEGENQMKGIPITLIVNPLLQVYGTDEAKSYDIARVWAPAEIWFNCK